MTTNLICPKCGKSGFVSGRWIRSIYYAEHSASPDKIYQDEGKYQRKFKVIGKRRYRLYMGHYDKGKYQKRKPDDRTGKRRSRPNGRKWCSLKGIHYEEILSQPSLRWFRLRLKKNVGDTEFANAIFEVKAIDRKTVHRTVFFKVETEPEP
jgi:hypothetical protein